LIPLRIAQRESAPRFRRNPLHDQEISDEENAIGITAPPRKHEFLTHPIEPWCPLSEWSRFTAILRRFYGRWATSFRPLAGWMDGYTRPVAGATGGIGPNFPTALLHDDLVRIQDEYNTQSHVPF